MKVLIDENIPRKLKWRLMEHDIDSVTVPERGWAGVKNGELLNRAEEEFDVLLTMDQGIEYQQDLDGRKLAIVTVTGSKNEYETLLPLVAEIVDAVRKAMGGAVVSVGL